MKSPPELSLRSDWVLALRAVLVALVGFTSLAARLPGAPSALPDRSASAAILEQFRRAIWFEPVYAEFELRQMPRRGPEHVFHGRFWGSRNERGPVTRIEFETVGGSFLHRFLVQGGPEGSIWTSDGPGPGKPSGASAVIPLAPGVEMTPFDVLPMPFLYWIDYDLVGVSRIRGRQSYEFVFTPPADFSALNPGIKSVRAYLDAQYDALVQSEAIGPGGQVAKTLSLLELRKVGDRWIPKDVDVRNEVTRDKTRLTLTGVAMGATPAPGAFDPYNLGSPVAPPPSNSVIRLEQ
ncbi:MAG: hypothetical protein WCA95_13915 [Opitutaceae bacterium]